MDHPDFAEFPNMGWNEKQKMISSLGEVVLDSFDIPGLNREKAYELLADELALKAAIQKRHARIDKAVSFTGHRPERLGGYGPNPTKDDVCAFLKRAILRLRDEGFEEFISGAALGVDQWAADIALELGLNVTFALPFAGYGENWPQESRDYLEAQKKKAKRIVVVCEGEYKPHKNHFRNTWMLDNSAVVVAVWNGAPDGGTASACRGLKKSGKRYIRYNPDTKQEELI